MQRRTLPILGLLFASIVLGGIGSRPILAQDASPAASPASCPVTTEEENAELVQRFIDEVYNAHDPARAAEFLAEDLNRSDRTRPHVNEPGLADDIARIERSVYEWPDALNTIEELIVADDLVIVRATTRGTHQGDFEDLGVPATGREAEWSGIYIWRIECGQLVENWAVVDRLGQYRHLGIITEDELATVGIPDVATPVP